MTGPDDPIGEELDAAYWEDRYRSGVGAGKLAPSPSLVTELRQLRPCRALDAGCGVGGDAPWLAARGWHHAHPEDARVRGELIVSGVPEDEEDVTVAASRTHTIRRPDGAGRLTRDGLMG